MGMVTKEEIIERALSLGFLDIGFTTADPFDKHKQLLQENKEEYSLIQSGLDLTGGTDPQTLLPGAQSIVVLVDSYFRESFPRFIEGNFGRCYLDDDRVTGGGLSKRVPEFQQFLKDHGVNSEVPFNMPHRAAAARAGLGTLGKNCLFYSRKLRQSSWVIPIPVVVDHAFLPDSPTQTYACPDWCRNACIAACPTKALRGNGTIDPRKCISFLSYNPSQEVTPLELREPMGMYVYGCDRCQNVCPRNASWLAQTLPENPCVLAKAEYFELRRLLAMSRDDFERHVWPHMFYMGADMLWKWKMNVARVMGNSLDVAYIPDLAQAYRQNEDERVRSMAAWALGKIGGSEARKILKEFSARADGAVKAEIEQALTSCK